MKPAWQPMATAPKDRPLLVKTGSGRSYVAAWSKNPLTNDEKFRVEGVALTDGTVFLLADPVEWMELPE